MFGLYREVIKKKEKPSLEIELKRKKLKKNSSYIEVIDFKRAKSQEKTIRSVIKSSTSTLKFSLFLMKLCNHLNIKTCLECGTSFGINTLYMAESKSINKVYTIEGAEAIAKIARKQFINHLKIELIKGNVYEKFEPTLVASQPELIFIDADHRGVALDYYLDAIKRLKPDIKCIIIHDIYWSPDMKEKWDKICQNQSYNLTIDLFEAGLIFPNYPMEKQHFVLKF